MSDQKICPTCGTEYPLSERFCPRDGTALRSAATTADLLGSIVADRYHILKKLGEGGMGTVYLAEHVKMGRKSALKVMNPGMNTDPDAIARFNREASNASRLSHPNICGIYDFGETPDGLIYLAMEFIEGSSLTSLIEKGGALPAARAGSIIHQASDALQVAHDAGIVHRDLKPDNIMIARNRDGTDLVKVVDFGIAKASSSDAQKVTKTGLVIGTPEYMSPEQLSGDKLDGRSDVYSLGLVAFNCLTGALPFASESAQEAMIMRLTDRPRTLSEVRPEMEWPAALQAVFDKVLARDANERYQGAALFGRELSAAIGDMPMTRAIEAGTQMVNAAAAAKEALPATRVGRRSAKTEAMAPPAPAPKARPQARGAATDVAPVSSGGNKGLIIGGLGVAGVAVAGLLILKPFGGAAANGANPGGGNPGPASAETSKVAANPPPVIPETTGTKAPNKAPDSTRPPANNGATSNPAPSAATVIKNWKDRLMSADEASQERIGREALREVEPLLASLTGIQLDDARFVALLGYAAINNIARTCEYERLVARSSLSASDKSIAAAFVADLSCPAR